jgi:RNA polymerase sigma-70 factor, ECF subfamily
MQSASHWHCLPPFDHVVYEIDRHDVFPIFSTLYTLAKIENFSCQEFVGSCVTLENIMPLSHETILSHLFAARQRLSAAAWLIVRDAHAAEDIFQNVALKALAKNVEFEHEGALLSWATISARHEAISWLRKSKPETLGLDVELLDLLDREWQSKTASREAGRTNALRDCLDATPADGRRLLELRYFEGRTCDEAAHALSIKIDAVYKQLSRLHRQLRLCIERRLGADTPLSSGAS